MYDWLELRDETDARWAAMRDGLRRRDIDAPEHLTRRNGDMPAVPGSIRDGQGNIIAADPENLPPDEFDLSVLWRHPDLLVSEACWGPMEMGLSSHVTVIGQIDYDDIAGGSGELYSSVIVAHRGEGRRIPPPAAGRAHLPTGFFRGKRFAFNEDESLSGYLALKRDLEAMGMSLAIFSEKVKTGAHRASIRAVAEGKADVAAIDCKSWALAQRVEPAAAELHAIGWTAQRKGLPLIRSRNLTAGLINPAIWAAS
ncbi:phosphate ABC transporter substrate-binding protein [Phyllobacterium salinisoli]|uniref:Phosphate ABC transporter substrate-binding protein n=1 Tax=Phyllobacterium salinisoli TaxID=1899321 RepID=A0A368K7F7_9HYPH|nr:PhnD/SsuA/transferrin family substrate-binding protein [Phyllobacterium salinisoli]RCS25151.1 phosphate ABC transporter substrate-binding protein [Phyllobacterium salinisoli]